MTVFVLIREDQNEHGYVDAARQEGLVVEDDDSPDGEWQVSWKVEEHTVD